MTDTYFTTYDDGRPDEWVFVEEGETPPVAGVDGVASAELQVVEGADEVETPEEEVAPDEAAEPEAAPEEVPVEAPVEEAAPAITPEEATGL